VVSRTFWSESKLILSREYAELMFQTSEKYDELIDAGIRADR
jgi:hypothetical protein